MRGRQGAYPLVMAGPCKTDGRMGMRPRSKYWITHGVSKYMLVEYCFHRLKGYAHDQLMIRPTIQGRKFAPSPKVSDNS